MTDASPSGGAAVQTDATMEEIKEEAAFASRGAWIVDRELH